MEPIMWSVTGYDWNAPSVEHIERQVTRQVRGGDVILLHDGGHLHFGSDRSYTVAATGRLISRYLAEGYEFVTVPEMMRKTDVRSYLSDLSQAGALANACFAAAMVW
jgi:peptidoglycan/xylan/chitin deacetylase (PgdA/CDA1 family)